MGWSCRYNGIALIMKRKRLIRSGLGHHYFDLKEKRKRELFIKRKY
jgi:hypothetical protein